MLDTLTAFAFFAFVASVTPGPNNVLLTATGSRVGFRRGMPTLLGITIGFALMIFVLTFGLGSLVLENPLVLRALKLIGVSMIVWLSWQIAFAPVDQTEPGQRTGSDLSHASNTSLNSSSSSNSNSASISNSSSTSNRASNETWDYEIGRPLGLIGAAMFQWVNPKAWLVVASAISAYMVPQHSAFIQAVTFASVFFVAGVIGCLPWLAFGSLMKRLLRTEKAARCFNYSMGLLLLATIVLIIR